MNNELYPLNWETQDVRLGEGRFVHTVRRPTPEEIFDRDKDLQSEIPIGKDGSYSLPDPTATEDVDVKLFDAIVVSSTGYPSGDVPASHKSTVITGLYRREVYIDDDTDVFAYEIPVLEEIGNGDEPDFVITHFMRQPTEEELKKYRRRNSAGEIKPGKRGKQRFVTKSNLKLAVEYYDLWIDRIEGVKLQAESDHGDYIGNIDPLIKRQVLNTLVDKITGSLLD